MNDEQSAGDDEASGDDTGEASFLTRLDEYPLFEGLVSGIASFLGGYVLLLGVLVATGKTNLSDGIDSVLTSVGYVFYNTIQVPTYQWREMTTVYENGSTGEVIARRAQTTEIWQNDVTGMRRIEREVAVNGDVINTTSQSASFDPGLGLAGLFYLAIPVVALLAVGYVYGDQRFELAEWDPNAVTIRGLTGGLTMTVGYLLVALAGTYVLTQTGSQGQSLLRPARFEAVLYGIAYPLVAGTVGVILGQLSLETLREIGEDGDGSGDDGA